MARFVVGVRRNIDSRDVSYSEYIAAINSELDVDELAEVRRGWLDRHVLFEAIVQSEFSGVLAKAAELSFLQDSHVHDLKIITELRPVMSTGLDRIVAQIVKCDMYITTSDALENESRFTVTVGLDDLLDLQHQVERALAKIATVRAELDRAGMPVKVYGEAGHD